jgi:hypothetical protein
MTYHTVAGMTGDQDFQLLDDEVPLSTPIQGLAVVLLLWDKYGVAVDTAADVTNLDNGTPPMRGLVRVNLDAADLNPGKSPYTGRFKVTDATGKHFYWPSGDADVWIVGRGA